MKKKILAVLLMTVLSAGMVACGGSDVNVVSGSSNATGTSVSVNGGNDSSSSADNTSSEGTVTVSENGDSAADAELSGYIFEAATDNGSMNIAVDEDMSSVLSVLGDPASYYEAESCAFQGLDKIYTYNHYEISTYPDGDIDRISSIYFRDDMVSTQEGLTIGDSFETMENIYGTDYVFDAGVYSYTKDGCQLVVIINAGEVSSIEYLSIAASGDQ